MRSGIIAGGNWIRDHVKVIEAWPQQDTLVTILHQRSGNGGSPYNILINLAHLGAKFPLCAVGLVGADDDGGAILKDCAEHRIDTARLQQTPDAATSYTDVMTVGSTGRRTFFHQRGANSKLAARHFDFTGSQQKIFHLGYLLLLDTLDQVVGGLPNACDVLQRARAAGLMTSLDCVSEDSHRFREIVLPVLPLVDILFANDFETEKTTGVTLRVDGVLSAEAVQLAGRKLIAAGVRSWAVIHFPEGVYACSAAGEGLWQPSLKVDPSAVVGAVGAGDALAAGVLYGIHEDWPMAESLRLGVSAAAASLFHASSSEGVKSVAECLEIFARLGCNPAPR
jgi:sugar/nucleoside kinase (ribokinase family)